MLDTLATKKSFCALLAAVTVLLLLLIGDGAAGTGKRAHTESVLAEITDVQTVTNEYGRTEYRYYVTYTHNGQTYTDKYYKTSRYEPDGNDRQVYVNVAPQDTAAAASTILSIAAALAASVTGMLFVGSCAVQVLNLFRIRRWRKLYGDGRLTPARVEADVQRDRQDKRTAHLAALMLYEAMVVIIGLTTGGEGTALHFVLLGICGVVTTCMLLQHPPQLCAPFTIGRETCQEIRLGSRKEEFWVFGDREWRMDPQLLVSLQGTDVRRFRKHGEFLVASNCNGLFKRVFIADEFSLDESSAENSAEAVDSPKEM